MTKLETLNRLYQTAIMAIVRIDTIQRGFEIVDGCLAGGVDCMEISFTNSRAPEFIRAIQEKYQDKMLVGAGTVLDSETARIAILAGAKFIISPNFSKDVAKLCNRYQVPYMPGCTSYTEVIEALEYGASMIKAFPISNYYGASLGKVFKTPLPYLPILSSGGATPENIGEWLKNGIQVVGVGSLLTTGTVENIRENAARFVEGVTLFRNN
ncbi:ketohydroxyglutarate aldolase [Granulicatella sp. zg-ZJ]|uniref:ketohydroxyglutarate aldolase n=1 Tax=unclassified Granulicatella TaxID=2630493 RepID=UPI0013C0EFD5|nr:MULTISPECIES: ketohydroxyglutarate aldolase [unclassified Granulicatella]MBS4750944.1 ketohydroxyglutarate aldolase [Carnobacteriaceae bacterium zg-ZUI78]NEW62167.1 ketohydroxyglutarate aldolase [Granulicatella sp. zg-ZJ]NEW66790.1 ketohydroxyglutarate aldolase [Granulicatella sp. zg-84]QMI85066.1 ketohydroxyglutarate aldolase [Carnobacteriaceae bacterium zg-84]